MTSDTILDWDLNNECVIALPPSMNGRAILDLLGTTNAEEFCGCPPNTILVLGSMTLGPRPSVRLKRRHLGYDITTVSPTATFRIYDAKDFSPLLAGEQVETEPVYQVKMPDEPILLGPDARPATGETRETMKKIMAASDVVRGPEIKPQDPVDPYIIRSQGTVDMTAVGGEFEEREFGSANYEKYRQFILKMHGLMLNGQFESEEADRLREDIEGVWDKLTEDEQNRLRGLSLGCPKSVVIFDHPEIKTAADMEAALRKAGDLRKLP